MRPTLISALAFFIFSFMLGWQTQARQGSEVFVQALGRANLRDAPSTEANFLVEITAGTEYRVLRQHAQVPWLLLEVPSLPTGAGWVFRDLVSVTRGDLSTVPFEESFAPLQPITDAPLPSPSPAPAGATPDLALGATALPAPIPAATLVTARLSGRTNIRFGPGVDYPIMLTLDEGTTMVVVSRHSLYPWYKIAIENAPSGTGWVFAENVEVTGDIYTLPVITDAVIPFPSPSPTPQAVIVASSPFANFGASDPLLAQTLGEALHSYLLSQGLAPRTDREGSVFVMDLSSGAHFTLNGGVAYSGMSINKIPILFSYFIHRNTPLEVQDAELVANTMICSENVTTNEMMSIIGDGDILAGGQRISQNMAALGLGNTFVVAPFDTNTPNATPAPVSSINTNADQKRTQPDLFNQLTVEEIGWLLAGMYQCGVNESGPLLETFPNALTPTECRQMLRVMSGNRIGALIESGIPPEAVLAHKHGWINNTHGDAGIVFGPQGRYVFSMVYHERTDWLDFEKSFPVIEEAARQTWNYFNPDFPLSQTLDKQVPATCNIYAETVIVDMVSGAFAPPPLSTPAAPAFTPTPSPTP